MTRFDLNPQEFMLLSQFIEKKCGILLKENKAYLIRNRLSHLVTEYGCRSFAEFYFRLRGERLGSPMLISVIDAITTGETSWFRDGHPFRILRKRLIPAFRLQIREGRRKTVKILSLGCSTGQEPYSIAMTALEAYGLYGGREACSKEIEILALDISEACLSIAGKAEYDHVALSRGLSSERKELFFQKSERGTWTVDRKVQNLVRFEGFNMGDRIWNMGPFDVVFLRNVIIYFADKAKREIFARTARIMEPGAFLFLGTGETVSGYTDLFDILEDDGAIYYQRKAPCRQSMA